MENGNIVANIIYNEAGEKVRNELGQILVQRDDTKEMLFVDDDVDAVGVGSQSQFSQSHQLSSHLPSHTTSHTWTEAETRSMLILYKVLEGDLKNRKIKNKKEMWGLIATKLAEEGVLVDGVQAENRFRTIRRQWLEVRNHNNRTGNDRKDFPYEKELEEILGWKDSIQPKVLLGSGGLRKRKKHAESIGNAVSEEENEEEVDNPRAVLSTPSEAQVTDAAVSPTFSPLSPSDSASQLTESDTNAASPTPSHTSASVVKKLRKGSTAWHLQQCNETLKEFRETKMKHNEAVLNIYKEEVEETRRFRLELLNKKEEKLRLLRELFGNK